MKKKIKRFIKNNIKVVIAFIIGLTIAGTTVYAATVISSSSVSYNNSSSGLTSTNVQGAIDEVYNKTKPTKFKIGDYVSMIPTKTTFTVPMTLTGYTSNQTINPSELKLWRVIRINSDNTVDMVSEYVSSVNVYFKGKTGYQNFIGTINYIGKQYENQKYTSGSRHMGYSGQIQTDYITDTTALTATTAPQKEFTSSSNVTKATEAKGLGDMGYEIDYNLVKTAVGTLVAKNLSGTATKYWLAARNYYCGSSINWGFIGRAITTSGSLYDNYLYRHYNGNFYTDSSSGSVRPIVTLKSGVKASSGNGSSSSPYVLS